LFTKLNVVCFYLAPVLIAPLIATKRCVYFKQKVDCFTNLRIFLKKKELFVIDYGFQISPKWLVTWVLETESNFCPYHVALKARRISNLHSVSPAVMCVCIAKWFGELNYSAASIFVLSLRAHLS
jgi:hypothetical protein